MLVLLSVIAVLLGLCLAVLIYAAFLFERIAQGAWDAAVGIKLLRDEQAMRHADRRTTRDIDG